MKFNNDIIIKNNKNNNLESAHVSRISSVFEAVLVAFHEKFDEESGIVKKS